MQHGMMQGLPSLPGSRQGGSLEAGASVTIQDWSIQMATSSGSIHMRSTDVFCSGSGVPTNTGEDNFHSQIVYFVNHPAPVQVIRISGEPCQAAAARPFPFVGNCIRILDPENEASWATAYH